MAGMSKNPDAIDLFVSRARAFCEKHDRSMTWLSKRLFNDTYRLGQLAEPDGDIGLRKLVKINADLDAIERETASA